MVKPLKIFRCAIMKLIEFSRFTAAVYHLQCTPCNWKITHSNHPCAQLVWKALFSQAWIIARDMPSSHCFTSLPLHRPRLEITSTRSPLFLLLHLFSYNYITSCAFFNLLSWSFYVLIASHNSILVPVQRPSVLLVRNWRVPSFFGIRLGKIFVTAPTYCSTLHCP